MLFLFRSLSLILNSSMKWRALICVYSYFAFYFSSVRKYFVSVLLSEMQMFVLKRLRSVKCHSICCCFFAPAYFVAMAKKETQISVWEKVRDKEWNSSREKLNEMKCENETNLYEMGWILLTTFFVMRWGFTLFVFFFAFFPSFHSLLSVCLSIYLLHFHSVSFAFSFIDRIHTEIAKH